ncbi:PREDICTED: 2-succinylbenzoate--CoA ligase, chloroplastic/peroxisomal isoform X2 [Ipomoea nil]|uniref:2-succinylbenzoate--CoA ligase, chloroplastic/peroxisomal isoform X2 n=1 Tax=Ipomoea nil TaxID=35883 RepID=UPI000900904E|nr:PREDICTED: 2-succinylbenzoate--CoA ligase, chloroplastic/peroxisomal isoform X2 [Ipomoea nil]
MANYSKAHICQCLSRVSTVRRSSTVTVAGDRRKTGAQLVEGVLSLARGLLQLGLKPGDVVAICALNSDLYLEWLLAVAYAGGITAPLNYRWSLEEAMEAVEVARPTLLVTDSMFNFWHSKLHADSIPSLRWHVSMDVPFGVKSTWTGLTTEKLTKHFEKSLATNYLWAPEGAAIICFTSGMPHVLISLFPSVLQAYLCNLLCSFYMTIGTTGRPKGVTLSHSALLVQSLAKIAIVGYGEDDVYLHTAPLCHIGGISSALAVLMAGGCHILIPKFDAGLAVGSIHQHHVTSLITVPAMMADLVSFYRKGAPEGSETVKKILNGGGALSVELITHAATIFPRAKLLSAYGMTEACSSLTFMTLYDPTNKSVRQQLQLNDVRNSNLARQPEGTCVGKPAPHVELRVCAEDYSSHIGRILTRGSHVMLGYWGQTSNKTSDLAGENWLDTGDIGQIDNHGNVWLIGRSKGRIKSGGENVYPEEVEAVLSQHPGVSGSVVVGVPDSRLGEMVVACIRVKGNWLWDDLSSNPSVSDTGNYLSGHILRCFCKEKQLTGFKVPKRFILWRRNQFPVTSTGKIRRDQVRRELMSNNMQLMISSKL